MRDCFHKQLSGMVFHQRRTSAGLLLHRIYFVWSIRFCGRFNTEVADDQPAVLEKFQVPLVLAIPLDYLDDLQLSGFDSIRNCNQPFVPKIRNGFGSRGIFVSECGDCDPQSHRKSHDYCDTYGRHN